MSFYRAKLFLGRSVRFLSRAVRKPYILKQYWDLYSDYRALKKQMRPIFAPNGDEQLEKRALIVSLSTDVFQFKQEAILGKALERHGFKPVILTSEANRTAVRYFKNVFYYDELVYLDHYIGKYEKQAREIVDDFIQKGELTDATAVKSLIYAGVSIGQQALSSLSRFTRSGRFELDDAEVKNTLIKILRQAIATTQAARDILDAICPDVLLFYEKGYAGITSFYDLAINRGTNVVQFCRGFRDDGLILKRYTAETRRVHPNSLSESTWNIVKRMTWDPEKDRELMNDFSARYSGKWFISGRDHHNRRILDQEQVRRELDLNPEKKTAVIFSHVLWDANMFYGKDLYDDFEQWLVETVKIAAKNDRVNWIVKLHPANVWKARKEGFEREDPRDQVALHEYVGALPGHVRLMPANSPINTFSLYDIMDYCITVRGSIGMEAPCFGVPVITAGTGRYTGLGFTCDPTTRAEYETILQHIEEIPALTPSEIELAKKHAYGIFVARPFRFSSFQSIHKSFNELGHPLDHNVMIHLHNRDQLDQAEDLKEFANWAIDSREADYIDLRNIYEYGQAHVKEPVVYTERRVSRAAASASQRHI